MEKHSVSNFLLVDKVNKVLQHGKSAFVGKDDIIDLMGICLVGRKILFLLGPPGTAKSALVRELARQLNGKTFEYLLTRFIVTVFPADARNQFGILEAGGKISVHDM